MAADELQGASEPQTPPRHLGRREVAPLEFFEAVDVRHERGVQGVVTLGRGGRPNDHAWHEGALATERYAPWATAQTHERKPAYYTMGAYDPERVERFKGRSMDNVLALGGFWLDIEGEEGKAGGGYPGRRAAMAAVGHFLMAIDARPNLLVLTGGEGVHLHFVLDVAIIPSEWKPRAQALVALAARHGLRIDAAVTVNAAQIMRAPGSIHQKTGRVAQAHEMRTQRWTLAEWDALVKFDVCTAPPAADIRVLDGARFSAQQLAVNADVLEPLPQYSYVQAATRCGAMRRAAQDHGRDASRPVWLLALVTAQGSIEGTSFAHEISAGHADYDEGETDKVLGSLTGGPANCETWASAFGVGSPCEACEFKGKIKNPAVQLGRVPQLLPALAAANDAATQHQDAQQVAVSVVEPWVAAVNERYAQVQIGPDVMVADSLAPDGMRMLTLAAFRQVLNGQFAPRTSGDGKPMPLAMAWLSNMGRASYNLLEFAPGEAPRPGVLNLWQGFAVQPVPGDVQPWLTVLHSLVPDEAERQYVLKWLAWKVQTPGGVPGTVLILRGLMGIGKNALFDPVVRAFGQHAMFANDSEQIVGKFTFHLMSKSLVILDEAIFAGDPKQMDRIKARVTGDVLPYEGKFLPVVQARNRCAFVMLTNHEYVWQASMDERRAVVLEVGDSLRGNVQFWEAYYDWLKAGGAAMVLHHLQGIDLQGFNPRVAPRTQALRRQIEQTALHDPAAAWWHTCLVEGVVQEGVGRHRWELNAQAETEIPRSALRQSYESSAAARGHNTQGWPAASRKLRKWVRASGLGIRTERPRVEGVRERMEWLPSLAALRRGFTAETGVQFDDEPDD